MAFTWKGLEALPWVVAAAIAAFGAVAVALLLAGDMSNALVWPLGLAAALGAGFVVWRHLPADRPGSKTEQHSFDALVLLGVLVWIVFNLFFTAHSVFITRDPGIYTVTGKWLMSHNETNINVSTPITGVPAIYNQSGGIWNDVKKPGGNVLQPQGAHLLPALLGLAGRVGGTTALFKLNVFIGGVALLAVYGFARLLARPRWAAVGTAVLAASLPMIYFSRDTYTEPLAVLLTIGALGLVWLAQARPREKNYWLWSVAGLTAGAGVLARADGYITIVAIAIFLVIATIVRPRSERASMSLKSLAFLVGAAIPAVIGWLDITRLTSSYYISQRHPILIQLILLGAVIFIGAVAIVVSYRTTWFKFLDTHTKTWRGDAALVAILAVSLVLLSRPLWMHAFSNSGGPSMGFINVLQGKLGDPITSRVYTEQTFQWLSWYIGVPFLFLGIVGLAIAAKEAMKGKGLLMAAGALVLAMTTLLYAIRPDITPDQIWASRRFLPVVFPGLVVFGAYALDKLSIIYFENKRLLGYTLAFFLAVFVVLQPLITSSPFLIKREKTQDYNALLTVCQTLPKNALLVWLGNSLQLDASQSLRAFCGIHSVGYNYQYIQTYAMDKSLDTTALKHIFTQAQQAGYVPFVAMHGSQNGQLNERLVQNFIPVAVYIDDQLEQTLTYPPSKTVKVGDSIELASILPNGTLAPFVRH